MKGLGRARVWSGWDGLGRSGWDWLGRSDGDGVGWEWYGMRLEMGSDRSGWDQMGSGWNGWDEDGMGQSS